MLTAISPVDGRYAAKTQDLSHFFSEFALIKYRVLVEVQYFTALVNHPLPQLQDFPTAKLDDLLRMANRFSMEDAERIKAIEKVTNHDVKAVEYFLKEQFDALGLEKYKEFIHFGLTSQDINNTATPLMIKHALYQVWLPALKEVRSKLSGLAEEWSGIPMLARTHGQPASPTALGKEVQVFVARIDEQLEQLEFPQLVSL